MSTREGRLVAGDERVRRLIAHFDDFLRAFTQAPPFRRAGQFEHHRQTIDARRHARSVEAALESAEFLEKLYSTLRAWGIGMRAGKLASFPEFSKRLRSQTGRLVALEGAALDDARLDVEGTAALLWELIRELQIVENKAVLVSGTKALHHLLPDLVPPIDRKYTQVFFLWNNPTFQYAQAECLFEAFSAFARIAKAVDPKRYVDGEWNSSLTKVIDNAIVGFIRTEAAKASRDGRSTTRQPKAPAPRRPMLKATQGGDRMASARVSVDEVWDRLKKHQGEEFTTKRGVKFTYSIVGATFRPGHVDHQVSKADFAKAIAQVPFQGPGVINKTVRGPAYVWAVLHDKRIRRQDW